MPPLLTGAKRTGVKRQRDCADCGAPVGYRDREHCCRCWRSITEAAAKAACPGCGKMRVLQAGTGQCASCSRACTGCGASGAAQGRVLCRACRRKERTERRLRAVSRAAAARLPAPGDRLVRLLLAARPGEETRRGPARRCGEVRRHAASACATAAGNNTPTGRSSPRAALISRLDDPPEWLGDFAATPPPGSPPQGGGPDRPARPAAGRRRPAHPQALLERSRLLGRGRSPGTLARTLEASS